MDETQLTRVLEGLVFVSSQPIALKRLQEVIQESDHQTIRRVIDRLNGEYQQTGRAFRIQEVAGGYQLVTLPEIAPWVKRLLQMPRESTLSKPALEALAIIAYRQPITKADIEAIRGVDATATLETLMERQFIRSAGRKDSPGRPILYGTTEEFLRHFGLKGLEALPPMPKGTVGTLPGLEEPLIHEAQPASE
jgi:segregation and condensation protein B